MTANQILICMIVEVVVLSIFIPLMIFSVKQHNKKVKEMYEEHNKEMQKIYNMKNKILWEEHNNEINKFRESLGLPKEKN